MLKNEFKQIKSTNNPRPRTSDAGSASPAVTQTHLERLNRELSTESKLKDTPDLLDTLDSDGIQTSAPVPRAVSSPLSFESLAIGNPFENQGANTTATTSTTPAEASRENLESKQAGYQAALEHEREPDLTTAYNLYEKALGDHLDVLDQRGVSLERAVSAAEEHEREPDLSNARDRLSSNNREIVETQRDLRTLRNESLTPPPPVDADTSRVRVESARQGYEQALEHEREPDLTTARQHYVNTLENHVGLLAQRTPSLERALSDAQEHGRQPDLSTAQSRLTENANEIRDTQITLSIIEDGAQVASDTGTLELDDRGPAVARLQDQLRELGYDPGTSDGWFGSGTLTALRSFQDDQLDALEVTLTLARSPMEADAINAQIQSLNTERRAAEAGPQTQRLLIDPRVDPLKLDSSGYGDLFADEHPDGSALFETGNYDKHVFRGVDLNLNQAESNTNEFNDGDNHVVVQSIFDPVVADKATTIDEYSVHINLPPGVDPQSVLLQLATDMDEFLGGEFKRLGDFQNQGEFPEVGQVIDIDVKDGGLPLPFTDRTLGESPFNAPVIISSVEEDSFSVQTIEYNNSEHLLHGTREWGYEIQPDGSVKFYTRGISVEDIQAAEGIPGLGSAKDGEKAFWTAWVDGIENYANTNGGSVVDGTRLIDQNSGPSGNQIWETLTPTQQAEIRDSQISGHQREANQLQDQFDIQVGEISEIRDIDELDGSDEIVDAIESGDPDEILKAIRRVINDNENSDERDIERAVSSLERLYRSVSNIDDLANEHRSEVQGWTDR